MYHRTSDSTHQFLNYKTNIIASVSIACRILQLCAIFLCTPATNELVINDREETVWSASATYRQVLRRIEYVEVLKLWNA